MKALLREFRLLPIVLIASACLLTLKVAGLLLDGGYVLSAAAPDQQTAQRETYGTIAAAAQPVPLPARSPVARAGAASDTTGAIGGDKPAASPDKAADAAAKPDKPPLPENPAGMKPAVVLPPPPANAVVDGRLVNLDAPPPPSPGERAVLERLQDRRQELDARAREIEIRESLLKATEKRLEAKAAEIRETEARIKAATEGKDAGEIARFKSLITMYENMKAKDAAKIFDRLDLKVLIDVASQINPRKMSDILALMSADSAERLTVELASRAAAVTRPAGTPDLPKIEGRPNGT